MVTDADSRAAGPAPALDASSRAEVVLPCPELALTVEWLRQRLGFELRMVMPADDPAVAVMQGHGVRLRLERADQPTDATLRIACQRPEAVADGARALVGPGGLRVQLVDASPAVAVPALQPSWVVSRLADAQWVTGRAGMRYRDLVPDRQGGRYIASHIVIPDGGPVPDYVHFHRVQAQFIYCLDGWARLVYEDQGPAFVVNAGDCVLQPPGIRHRVLECSAGLAVLEVGCPAVHETWTDPVMTLPTPQVRPGRLFEGQRFHWHRAERASWKASPYAGWEMRETGIASASVDRVGIVAVRPRLPGAAIEAEGHQGALGLYFATRGAARMRCDGRRAVSMVSQDAVVVPAGCRHVIDDASEDFEMLYVTA
ncbi:MAG: cupin domain-containing protein [Deltaproteobacteria bacterium]|nr:cupin domain-containing protein [Deltaproteobacteria bacterium]